MPTAFDALARNGSSGSSSTSSEEDEINQDHRGGHQKGVASSCFYEDLTTQRADEETVLDAVYGDDFSKEDGVWGCPILSVHVRPSDIEEKRIGTKLTLKVQLVKKYPSVSPSIELSNVKGLNAKEQRNLLKMLKNKCRSLAASSVVMVCELVLIVEDFLFSHNKDPTLSSWDLMNAREEEKKKVAQEAERRLDFMREDGSPSALRDSVYDQQHSSNNNIDKIEKEKIEREYARQMEALKADEEDRRKRLMSQDYSDGGSDTNDISFDGEDDDDDFEFNESYDDNNASSSSRYKSDFIELGHLGKGGGGEVVKARNRLDRRTYAVKKVVLQLERGNFEKSGKLENAKLKREVTTISRMTHKNIVRYYQAWVEGGGKCEERNSHGDSGGSESHERKIESCASEKSSESSSEESESSRSNQGFWTSNFSDESVDSSSSWSDEDEHTAATPQNCDDADFHNNFSPLLAGLGLGNPDSDLMKRYKKSRTNESSNIFGESDSEMDPSQINDGSRSILYIQMEYCSTTLRRLIDDTLLQKMEKEEVWKLVRQMLEALVYIHKRKVIHRDLKPGNVFLDAGNNIRLGDFGLATTRKSSRLDDTLEDASLQLDDISHLIGDPLHSTTSNKSNIADDTITGGVGTRFYCAPEQEGRNLNVTKGRPSYDTKADIFSLGIVLFEMFHPPFSTMMHRAETLEQLRASSGCYSTLMNDIPKGNILDNDLWKEHAKLRFPEAFRVTFCPENAQKLILWCLQHDATKRPSAEDILKSDLIPQLENRNEVLKAMFDRQTVSMSNEIDITWDTDAAAKVREHFPMSGKNSLMNSLLDNLREFASFSGKDKFGLQSSAMNCVAMMAANTALKRASHAGKIRGAPHYTASILAMAAATTSASTGHADGFLPRLTDSICNQLTKIFQSHGAVELKPPLLRPKGRIENGKDGHVEVMNERGIILLLPEDLTANFARSIGRAGGIGVKRYDIDKTFHKSKVGGHPRESLEASFDIVLEGANAHSNIFEAEVILVICQVMRNFVNHLPSVTFSQASTPKSNPFWFLRLTHTRLADAILDVCDVPTKESTRRACLHILTRCSAPPPSLVLSDDQTENLAKSKFKKQNSSEDNRSTPEEILDNLLEKAVQEQGLTKVASGNLRTFLTNGCLPLPSDVTEALKNLQEATKKVRLTNDKSKRSKRYFDIARGIKAIQNLINVMNEMGISPSNHGCQLDGTRFLPPVYISLDLGLRQRQKHFQGNLYFQALLLPDNCKEEPSLFDENNTLLSGNPKTAIKIAEGGHYEELVRKFRPPGNFGSIQLDKYTSAPIPMCVGTRIFVRRLVERAYFEASFTARMESHTTRGSLSNTGTESIRRSLGHPLAVYSCVQCMIVGINGFDSETLQTRAAIAARLWSEDISAEYVPQSGVMTSLLKHTSTPNFMSETSDWTVDQIGGICGLLKIPFLVIVQDHLLRDKGCVRLRIVQDSHPNISPIEYVRLSVLASVMKDHLQRKENSFQSTEINVLPDRSKVQTTNQDVTGSKSTSVDVECIFIDSDQFYLDVDNLSGRDPKSKSIKKIVKTSTQRVESYLENLCSASTHGEGCTVLAVKIPFMVLREFDSAAMFGDGPTVVISVSEILSKYPKHRKALKTLAMCLDHLLRRQHESSSADMNGKSKSTETKKSSEFFSALVYSIQDDRFDLLTLSHTSNSLESASHHEGSSGTPSTKSRRERNRR